MKWAPIKSVYGMKKGRYHRRGEECDPKAIKGSSHQRLRGGIVISGVDEALEVRALLLDASHRAPENPLSAAAVVGVRMEEPHRALPPESAVDYAETNSDNHCGNNCSDDCNDHRRQC